MLTPLSSNSNNHPKLALRRATLAGGYSWNETHVRALVKAAPDLSSLVLFRLCLNGTYLPASTKTITWSNLIEYAKSTMPALSLASCNLRFRAKLPSHVLSIDLSPKSSYSMASARSDLIEDEWTLPQTFPALPSSLTAVHIQSKQLRIFGDEFGAVLAPSLLRLSLHCKCILNDDWPSSLPSQLNYVSLPIAVCRNGSEALQISQFAHCSKLTHLIVPLMNVLPPTSPADLPPTLVRLTIIKPWSASFLKAIEQSILPNFFIN